MNPIAELFRAIAARPPVLWGAIGGLITMLGGNVAALAPYEPLLMLVIPSLFGWLASRFTIGPATGKVLAEAVKTVQNQTLRNPDGPISSVTPSVSAMRAAERVLSAKPPVREARQ